MMTRMKKFSVSAILALTLGMTHAQITPTPAPTPTAPVVVSVKAASLGALKDGLAQLKSFIQAGGSVTLSDAKGALVGTLNSDGTVTLAQGRTLAEGTLLNISTPAGSDQAANTQRFALARTLDQEGMPKIVVTNKNGKSQEVALSALIHRSQMATQTKVEREKPEKNKQNTKPEKAPKNEKSPEHPGKGKSHSKGR